MPSNELAGDSNPLNLQMLVRESQPMPKQRPAAPPADDAAGPTPAAAAQPAAEPAPGRQGVLPAAAPGAPAPKGRRLAAVGAHGSGRQPTGVKAGLDLRRTGRR